MAKINKKRAQVQIRE